MYHNPYCDGWFWCNIKQICPIPWFDLSKLCQKITLLGCELIIRPCLSRKYSISYLGVVSLPMESPIWLEITMFMHDVNWFDSEWICQHGTTVNETGCLYSWFKEKWCFVDDIWKNGHAATADSRKNEFIQMREKKGDTSWHTCYLCWNKSLKSENALRINLG